MHAVVASALLVVMAACGAASSNNPPPPPAPTITSLAPTSGRSGTAVVITGTNLTGATAVMFNTKAASGFAVNSATQITATVPNASSSGKVTVFTAGGTAVSATDFTVTDPPTITSFTPASGAVGTVVTITGTNFTGATTVKFNSTNATTFTVNSSTQIKATVAAGTTTGPISVTTANGTGVSANNFTVGLLPTITGFNPASGPVGTSVVITGTNFTGATAVKFNSTNATTFTVNSATQITATVAAGTTTGKVTVTTAGGTATSAGNFTVTAAPTITSFSPGSGPVGTNVVITGTNFTGATAVAFNGKAASSFTVNSATQITATVATATTTGKITVTNAVGTGTSATNFTVTTGSTTLDLTIDGLYVTQATQDYPTPSVPLVQNRSAWVRVFVKANQANTATPQVKVDFIKGATTNTLTINAPGTSVPLTVDPASATTSWNAAVSASWIQTGTQVVAKVDPTNAVQEADDTNNTFTQNLDVRNLKQWKVTLIPVHTGDGNQGVVGPAGHTAADWTDFAKRIHPVPDVIDVTIGSVMNSSVNILTNNQSVWSTVLNELDAKRTADGVTDRYYFGAVHPTYSSGIAGLGFIGWPAAIGWDVSGSFPGVFAHEEGHNFNRPHSPCGGVSGPDPNYPYTGGVIGVPGWDVFASSNNIKSATTYTDIMGYCSPQWISDYVYSLELTYRQNSAIGIIVPGPDAAAVSGDGLLIWGRIEDGKMVLEPAFRVPANSGKPEPGPYTWEARDQLGRVLASANFNAHEVADLPDGSVQMFSFIVPLKADVLAAVQTMHVKSGDQEVARRQVSSTADLESTVHMQDLPSGGLQLTWDAERFPVLMLRDASTGEVRGFVRGGNAQIDAAPREIEVRAPDSTRRDGMRHERVVE